MHRFAGYVFDPYDDTDGRVLRTFAPTPEDVPEIVKTAARLTPQDIQKTSDDHFALVLLDEGRKLKKYATVDRGNTALSVAYLLKQAHLLPKDAVKIAAKNLMAASNYYGLSIPYELKIAAVTGTSPVSGKSQKPYLNNVVNNKQAPLRENPQESSSNPQLGHHDGANADVDQRTNLGGTQGTNFMQVPRMTEKEHMDALPPVEKTASMEVSHHTVMKNAKKDMHIAPGFVVKKGEDLIIHPYDHEKQAVPLENARGQILYFSHSQPEETMSKLASFSQEFLADDKPIGQAGDVRAFGRRQMTRETPYVDVSRWDPSAASYEDHAPPDQTLLEGKYPVDSYNQVKTASSYFQENWKNFHPRDRHEYCVKLAARMEELNMSVPEDIARYGSTTYASDVDGLVEQRRGLVDEEYLPALDTLLEKRAQVNPETFAEALAEFDKLAGLRWVWGVSVADPWATTFGASTEKIAAENWSWDQNGCRIGIDELENLARNGNELVTKSFGPDFAKQFQKNPKTVFESLPMPNQLVLARMAMDRHAGTATE